MEFDFLGIFTLVTGVLFLILEIRQSNWMWAFQLLSAAAAMVSFFMGGLYASSALNLYYVVMAFVGFRQWRRDEGRLREAVESHSAQGCDARRECLSEGNGGNELHLRRLGWKTLVLSTLLMIAGTSVLFFLLLGLCRLNDRLDDRILVGQFLFLDRIVLRLSSLIV